jgi:hypothetical protein
MKAIAYCGHQLKTEKRIAISGLRKILVVFREIQMVDKYCCLSALQGILLFKVKWPVIQLGKNRNGNQTQKRNKQAQLHAIECLKP